MAKQWGLGEIESGLFGYLKTGYSRYSAQMATLIGIEHSENKSMDYPRQYYFHTLRPKQVTTEDLASHMGQKEVTHTHTQCKEIIPQWCFCCFQYKTMNLCKSDMFQLS